MNLTEISNSLPHGWTIAIDLQKGSCGVTLLGPFGDEYEPETGGRLAEADIEAAAFFARSQGAGMGSRLKNKACEGPQE